MRPDYTPFLEQARRTALAPWADVLFQHSQALMSGETANHGDWESWLAALDALPQIDISPADIDINHDTIRAGVSRNCDSTEQRRIHDALQMLHPWRKGPYEVCGVRIDTEWRSDWKWNRLKDHIKPLTGKTVLDIGCGSGYHTWRMAGGGAKLAVGIDPYLIFVMQYWAMRHFLGNYPAWVLPLGIEDLPPETHAFDTVFSMGVLYHRKSPMEHLALLRDQLKNGGEAVLETLVIDGGVNDVLVPEGRYAKMRNVWFIPSVLALESWMRKCGFVNVRTVDVGRTTLEEQRTTPWMRWESLRDYLDLADAARTAEGHPAPCRAIILAEAP